MIYQTLLLFIAFSWVSLFGQEAEKITFSTITGKNFENVKVMRVTPDSIQVMSSSGITRVPMTELPKDLQLKYGYNPEKASQFAKQDAAKQNAIRQQLARERQRMNAAQESNSEAVSPQSPQPVAKWIQTDEYTPEFKDLQNKAEAAAGGRKVSGSDRKSGAVYTQGRFRGKTKAELIEIVKTEYRKIYPGKSYFVLKQISDSPPASPAPSSSNTAILKTEIETLELEIEALEYEITALSASNDPDDSMKFVAAQQKREAKGKLLALKKKMLSGR